jgi:glycosyltransferase involved in cell wall biosynthesis
VTEVTACTVVISTRDRPDNLNQCLAAVSKQECPGLDVLVVDSAPTRPVADIAARWRARYLIEPAPGLSRARNLGARHSTHAEVIAFIDDDAVADMNWLLPLMKEFEDPAVAAVTGQIRYGPIAAPDAWMQSIVKEWASRPRCVIDASVKGWFVRTALGGMGGGANIAIRRNAFGASIFDERLGRGAIIDGGEESFALASAVERGHRIVYAPDAIVHHPAPQTDEQLRARKVDPVRVTTAYMLLLMAEFPRHRRELLTYSIASRAGIQRLRWRPRPPKARAPLIRTVASAAGGVLTFLRANKARSS